MLSSGMDIDNNDVTYADMDGLYRVVLYSYHPDRAYIMDELNKALTWDPLVGKYRVDDMRAYQLLKLRHGF